MRWRIRTESGWLIRRYTRREDASTAPGPTDFPQGGDSAYPRAYGFPPRRAVRRRRVSAILTSTRGRAGWPGSRRHPPPQSVGEALRGFRRSHRRNGCRPGRVHGAVRPPPMLPHPPGRAPETRALPKIFRPLLRRSSRAAAGTPRRASPRASPSPAASCSASGQGAAATSGSTPSGRRTGGRRACRGPRPG